MTNNNQVNWDEIPEDVEAVITFESDVPTYIKGIAGNLLIQNYIQHGYGEISCVGIDYYRDTYSDRFHLRPSPTNQPNPKPPESTQVESSEVEGTIIPEFDWSSVAEDVEAVLLSNGECKQWFKTIDGTLFVNRLHMEGGYDICYYTTLDRREEALQHYAGGFGITELLRRPPATTPTEDIGLNAAYDIYKKVAAEVDRIGRDSKPSISTILQEAQQSILKHHGVTGKVSFTVEYSE